jgi:hypothetical protein
MTAMKTRLAARKASKTPEQHRAEREALLETLNGKITTLSNSAEWIAYLNFTRAFRKYSFNNQMLILTQRPDATRVAGFRKWQEFGRQVRKGERAIKILGYSSRKVVQTNPATGEDEESQIPTFPILSVFDVSQTEGDDLPDQGCVLPESSDHGFQLNLLKTWLAVEGWIVETEETRSGLEGYTSHVGKRIALSDKLGIDAQLAVLLHEAAHALLHKDSAEYVAHRGLAETEAESAAYVLAGLLGLDLDASSISYVAGWANSKPEVLQAAAQNVLKAVNTIAAGIGLDPTEEVT